MLERQRQRVRDREAEMKVNIAGAKRQLALLYDCTAARQPPQRHGGGGDVLELQVVYAGSIVIEGSHHLSKQARKRARRPREQSKQTEGASW